MGQDDAAPGRAMLAQAVSAYRQVLGPRLLAAYALCSLAHGGFSPLVSDIDLGVVLRGCCSPAKTSAQACPAPSGTNWVVAGAEFALDFLAGVSAAEVPTGPVVGSLRPAPPDAVEQLRRPELLLAHGVRHVTKVVLFPVRFLYTAATGLVGTNRSAVEHYRAADPRPPATDLVAAALTWRGAPPDGAGAEALLETEMIPLYLHYIDDHIARLIDLGRSDLAEAFGEWRRQILR